MIAILIVQTRSLFLTVLIGIVFALITIFVLSSKANEAQRKGNLLRVAMERSNFVV